MHMYMYVYFQVSKCTNWSKEARYKESPNSPARLPGRKASMQEEGKGQRKKKNKSKSKKQSRFGYQAPLEEKGHAKTIDM